MQSICTSCAAVAQRFHRALFPRVSSSPRSGRWVVRRSYSSSGTSPAPPAGTSPPPPPPPPKVLGPVSWPTLFLTIATGCGVVFYYKVVKERKVSEASSKVEGYGKPLLGGPWSLVDGDGVPRTSGDYLGQYVLLYFGFTFCPDICPNELVKMARVVSALDATPECSGRVVPMFISLDPYRDTCEQVKAYCKDFHPRMVGLTGTQGQVAKAAKAYRVYFSEVDRKEGQDNDDYLGACWPILPPPLQILRPPTPSPRSRSFPLFPPIPAARVRSGPLRSNLPPGPRRGVRGLFYAAHDTRRD